MKAAIGAILNLTLILLLGAVAPRTAAQSGKSSFEGMVVRTGDNSPVAGAHVTLVPTDHDSNGELALLEKGFAEELALISPLSATTDDNGKFALTTVDPEKTYRMVIRAEGYVRQEYGQRTFPGTGQRIRVQPGQVSQHFDVRLTPTGSIEGTIRSVSGDPLQNVRVRLMRYVFNNRGIKHLEMAASTTTSDIGKYRLYFLTPGRYFLHAERIELHSDYSRGQMAPFGPAFYPGESDITHASAIEVQPGVNRSGMDLILTSDRLYRIRGRIVNAKTGGVIEKGFELLELFDLSSNALPERDGDSNGMLFKSTYSEDTGEFEFQNVPPGKYGIAGSTLGQESGGSVIVQVDADIENVKLPYGSGTTISGTLRADGRVDLSSVFIAVTPTVPVEGVGSYSSDFDGDSNRTFTIPDVAPGEYRLNIHNSSLPDGSYIKEARYGVIDALNQPFQISTSETRKLQIVIALSASVEGRLVNDNRTTVPGKIVVLIPDRPRARPELYKMEIAGEDGHFKMHGIAPGDYRLFAWESIEPYSWFDPEVIRRFETSGRAVHITGASTQSIEIKVIPFVP
jgi:hypothetical protein